MAFLVMNRGKDAARERLLEVFWPDADPDHARDSLKTALWSIRRSLRTAGGEADEFVTATKSTVRWTADTIVDAFQFAERAAAGKPVADQEALQLYRGDFLEGDYDNWAVSERERLAALYENVLARLVRVSKDTDAAQRFIARNPYDEEAYVALIEAELAAGRRSSAASWVERCRKALSEVGETPSAAFEARFGKIIHIEPLVQDELTLPFAGRDAELGLLAARLGHAASGRGSVTLVHGEAGIGKSTLLDRAGQIAAEKGLRVLVIRCAREVPSAFGPWPEIFGAVAAGDFDTVVKTHASDPVAAVAQALAATLTEPTAVFVDDAHELTAEALDIFVGVVQLALSRRAIIVGLRPEGIALMRSRLADAPLEELPIGRLDRGNLKWALAQALGSEQPDVLDVLYGRTAGHPLFFTGLLNSLVSAGTLTRDGRRWRLSKPIDAEIELPDTMRRFIETRLASRGDAPRAVAGALALEPAANADDLGAVLRMDDSSVLDALDDLLALGLIVQPASGTQFAFSHELIREVAAAGLNAGRRAALHRAFAQRLTASGVRESSLRLARHFASAGESLPAAQAYLKAAREALELNAAQDALNRSEAGIREAERLERTASRDILLARLHRAAARAAFCSGDANDAIRHARDDVTAARASGEAHELAQALVNLAGTEGAAYQSSQQQSDAAEAEREARVVGDETLEAQALVLQANAARELRLRDEALRAAQAANTIARRCGRSDIAQTALEELLSAQVTWWLFSGAAETARTGLANARRSDPLAEAVFLQIRCAFWYLADRIEDARLELRTSTRIANEAAARPQESLLVSLPNLQFTGQYMAGKIAVAQGEWDQALEAVEKAAALRNVAKLPRHAEALALLRIDALLRRDHPGDRDAARELTTSLGEATLAQSMIGWSDCVELARARVSARLQSSGAGALLRRTLNIVEENANRAPLDADWAFARIAEAAQEVGETAIAGRASGRSDYYRSHRLAAAGAARGGELSASLP